VNAALVSLALQEAPAAISAIKALFGKQNPSEPPPSDEQVIAAYRTAFQSSLDKDEQWLASHPEDVPPAPPAPAVVEEHAAAGDDAGSVE
jgi:hypothetical protein